MWTKIGTVQQLDTGNKPVTEIFSKFDLIIFIAEFKMTAKSEMATILIKENRHFGTKQLVAWELQMMSHFLLLVLSK